MAYRKPLAPRSPRSAPKSTHRRKLKRIYPALNPPKQEFRLLLLRAGQASDPVRCELQPARFSRRSLQLYETISYCWGDPRKRSVVHLHGKALSVPASSAAALRCVRLFDRDRTVWIDALCINQNDKDERAQQVSMMADIYSSSQGNLVYLGEADETTERAIWSIEKIMDDIKQRTNNFTSIDTNIFDSYRHRHLSWDHVDCDIDEPAVTRFYSHPWFQ